MRLLSCRPLLLAAAFFVSGAQLRAQQPTTPAQPPTLPSSPSSSNPSAAAAAAALRNRPELAQQLQQRLLTSGLTPEQIRARLRAEGYPESMLDAYLPGSTMRADADTTNAAELLTAVQALGVVDSTDAEQLKITAGLSRPGADSLSDSTAVADTTRRGRLAADSARLRADSGFTIFGLSLFKNPTTQFDANLTGPVDANYRLGPGDRLVLILTGDVEQAYTLDVTREGFVVVPQVGQLYVANLTLGQLDDLLLTRLRRAFSGIGRGPGATTRYSISVARLRSNQVVVVGDVAKPGSYRVSSAGTGFMALYAAGGPTETGSMRRIVLRRAGRSIDTLDVYDYLLRGDATHDVRLETGDVIFVPPHGPRVRVVGQVLRPATYEMVPGETLAQLIASAGGFQATASQQQIQIERILPPAERAAGGRDRVVINVPLANAAAVPNVAVQPGDVVRVFEVANRVRNVVTVRGNVWNPGRQGLRPGMRLSEALRAAGGVKPDTYLGEVLVSRLRSDSSRVQYRATLRDTSGAVVNDFALEEDDDVRVFGVTEFRPTRYVAISGAVRKGGRFPYREGITVRDLVLLAGGLDQSALLNEAEVARLPANRANGVTATTFRVALDSSYLFDRTPDGRYVGPPGIPASKGPSTDIVLAPYDNVLILRQPDFELQRSVYIGGEVRYPGRYALRTKSERLSDLVARAGGLTSEGYAGGIDFRRTRNRVGRVGLDLSAVLKDDRNRDNLVLADGDSIIVPAYSGIVTVLGAVNAPVAVAYVPGRDTDYYINSAGGFRQNADESHTYVVQPNGKLQSVVIRRFAPDSKPQPRPGARVVVPTKQPGSERDLTQVLALIGSIAGTLTAVIAVIAAVKK